MRSLDTNVLARFITQDDVDQTRIADAVLAAPCFVSDTVLLETAWLLASRYRVGRAVLAATLRDLLLLPTVTVSDGELIRWAIDRFAAGADFADMMHLVSGRGGDSFATFERHLAERAGPAAPIAIETLA